MTVPAKWISVKDKLPPDAPKKAWFDRGQKYRSSKSVLAFNGCMSVAEVLTNPQGENVWVTGDESLTNVTHWMPLPDPPNSKESL